MDNNLKARLEAEFLGTFEAEEEPHSLLEEKKASDDLCYKFCGKIGGMEKIIRKERALAAAKPDLILNDTNPRNSLFS